MKEEDKDLKIALALAKKGHHFSEYKKAEQEAKKHYEKYLEADKELEKLGKENVKKQ